MTKAIAWAGSFLGILGALILSMNVSFSGWGYVFFLSSSSLLSVWSYVEKHHHQLIMQGVFTAINFNGCIQWLT